MKRRRVEIAVLAGWLITGALNIAVHPSARWVAWEIDNLYFLFSVALVVVLAARAVSYVRERSRIKRAGGTFFTTRFVKRFLIVGWLLAILFRLATFEGVPNLISIAPFWAFTLGLIGFFVWRRVAKRRAGSPPPADAVNS